MTTREQYDFEADAAAEREEAEVAQLEAERGVTRRLKRWARSTDFKKASVARALLFFTPASVLAYARADLDTSLLREKKDAD